jgi:hypothetical protein
MTGMSGMASILQFNILLLLIILKKCFNIISNYFQPDTRQPDIHTLRRKK